MNSQDKKEMVWLFFEDYRRLRRIWDEYYFLYETSEVHHNLLDESAKNFFDDLQEVFKEYIISNICKIADNPRFGRLNNLTIKYIIELVGAEAVRQLGIDKLSERIHSFASCLRPARNKITNHTDLATKVSGKMLGVSTKEDVDSFWADFQEFVSKVSEHFFGWPWAPDDVGIRNAKVLIEALKRSVP